MDTADSTLTLVLPPCSIPETDQPLFAEQLSRHASELKNIRTLFARGQREASAAQATALGHCFGFNFQSVDDIPFATLMAAGNGIDSSTGYWLCAEPVHLQPDLDHVVLFDHYSFELSQLELSHLLEDIKPLLTESGIEPHVGDDHIIYLRLGDVPQAQFTAIHDVVGKNILPFMPGGEQASKWSLLANEIQMLMTQSDTNTQREQRGELPVNGLWFWGGGFLSPQRYAQQYDEVFSVDPLARGLANFRGITANATDKDFADVDLGRRTLISLGAPTREPEHCMDMLLNIERNWLTPAFQALKKGTLGTLVVLGDHGWVSMNKKALGRFWKRPLAVKDLVECL